MAKCDDCGTDVPDPKEICPKCGYNPGPETVTELPKAKIRHGKKKPRVDLPDKKRNIVCKSCRTSIPGNTNICPKCGIAPGPQAWSDLPGIKDK